jgi:hypothetical protein
MKNLLKQTRSLRLLLQTDQLWKRNIMQNRQNRHQKNTSQKRPHQKRTRRRRRWKAMSQKLHNTQSLLKSKESEQEEAPQPQKSPIRVKNRNKEDGSK